MRPHATGARYKRRADGFIIVAVLWIIAALATVAGIYAFYVRETAAAFAGHTDRLRAQALARAGVELAAYRLLAASERTLARGIISFRAADGRVSVDVQPESGRIDLNVAPKEILVGLFISLGVKADMAEEHSNRILAWRTPPTPGASDEEASLYRISGKTYGPRRALFEHADELSLVLGIPAALAERALPYLTVYSGRAEINALSAPPQVLAALPGMNSEMLHAIVERRQVAPQQIIQSPGNFLGAAMKYVTVDFGATARLAIEVELEGRRRILSEAVIALIAGDTEPYRILSWRDEIAAE